MPVLKTGASARRRKAQRRGLLLTASALLFLGARLTREYDLKAAFLFNFAQFVEWPDEAFLDRSAPFAICVLGEDPFGRSLDEIVANETVGTRKLVVRRLGETKQIEGCQILFISPSYALAPDRAPELLESKGVLTVGETDEFTARAGIIRFLTSDKRIRLKINVGAARAAKLSISSKLLRQAEIVDTGSK